MRKHIISLLILMVSVAAHSQTKTNQVVKWYTIQEAEKLVKKSPRPMFIDTYTDWCGWCKKMDKDTFSNSVISELLNTQFYPVKFDAEGKDSLTFFGKKFINDGKTGKTHQLAVVLLNGQLAYPTVVFLVPQSDGKISISPIPGYKEPKEMELILSYFSNKTYETQKWEDFQKNFKGKIQ